MKLTINNTTYKSIRETEGCSGCVADNNSPLCAQLALDEHGNNRCAEAEIIWIEQVNPEQAVTLQTSAGPLLQSATVEGHRRCQGCVAQLDGNLCLEIAEQHACIETPKQIWIKAQPVAPNIPEVLSILQEECAEVIQAVSKVQRFGVLAHHPHRTTTNKQELEEELGDLLAMIEILTQTGYLDQANIQLATQAKADKLKQYSTVWTSKPTN